MTSKTLTRDELIEREAHWAKWPNGDAGDAIDYALDHIDEAENAVYFLEWWRTGDLNSFVDYQRWLNVQRDGARAALRRGNQS